MEKPSPTFASVTVANIPGADKAKFDAAVKAAETGCPVSKLFKAEITVNARLQS